MAQYQSYCHINFVLNIKGAGLINNFTAFIAIFTFYGAGQNGSLRRYLWFYFLPKSQILPRFITIYFRVTGAKSILNKIFALIYPTKNTNSAATKKTNHLSSHHFTSQPSHLYQQIFLSRTDRSCLTQKCVIKLVKNGSKCSSNQINARL